MDIITQAKVRSEFHHLNCSDAICKAQIKERVKKPAWRATDTSEVFDEIISSS